MKEAEPIRKVLQVCRPMSGGMRRHLQMLLAHLPEQGWLPDVALPSSVELENPARRFDIEIEDRPSVGRDAVCALKLRKCIRRSGAHLVHAHGVRAAWISALAGLAPSVVTLHNLLPPPRGLSRSAVATALRSANRLIAVSEAVRDTAVAAGAGVGRIAVVPNAVEQASAPASDAESVRREFGIPEGAAVFLCVARLMKDKGVDLLLEAWAQGAPALPNWVLLIAGDGPDMSELSRTAASLPSVRMLGHVDDVRPLYDAAEVVVIPSRSEGQSIVCLEAMASANPPVVVAFRTGGLPEMIADGETGYLAEPCDTHSLAVALARAAHERDEAGRQSANAAEMVRQRYTTGAMLAATVSQYRLAIRLPR